MRWTPSMRTAPWLLDSPAPSPRRRPRRGRGPGGVPRYLARRGPVRDGQGQRADRLAIVHHGHRRHSPPPADHELPASRRAPGRPSRSSRPTSGARCRQPRPRRVLRGPRHPVQRPARGDRARLLRRAEPGRIAERTGVRWAPSRGASASRSAMRRSSTRPRQGTGHDDPRAMDWDTIRERRRCSCSARSARQGGGRSERLATYQTLMRSCSSSRTRGVAAARAGAHRAGRRLKARSSPPPTTCARAPPVDGDRRRRRAGATRRANGDGRPRPSKPQQRPSKRHPRPRQPGHPPHPSA